VKLFTVDGSATKFMLPFFTAYATAVKEPTGSGKELEGIDVNFCQSTVKPLYG